MNPYARAVLGTTHPPALALSRAEREELVALYLRMTPEQLGALSPEERAELEGLFDFVGDAVKAVGKAVGGAAKAVGHAVGDAADAVDKAYVKATPQWLRKGLGAIVAPVKMVWDTVDNIAHGERIDRALMDAGKTQVDIFKTVAPIAQLGLSFIPGIGTAAAGVLGAAVALADGKKITDALIAGVAGTLPGGPIVSKAVEMGANAAIGIAEGKSFDTIALDAVRSQLPGGEAVKIAFDTGLALAQGKKIQEAGLSAAEHLLPNNELAHGAFEMTKRALAGVSLTGSTHAAMKRVESRGFPVKRHPPATRHAPMPRQHAPASRVAMRPMLSPMRAYVHVPNGAPHGSHALPIALGVTALAALGGGAWWWVHHQKASEPR